MALDLPQPIAAYFGAVNARDIRGVIRCFAAGAVVKDEGQEYRGIEAIRGWIKAAIQKYDFAVEPTELVEAGGQSIVTGVLSGNFPGSPVSVRHRFTFEAEKVRRLEIG